MIKNTCIKKNIKNWIPCLITYNRKLPIMRKIINKHWNVLQINLRGHAIKNRKVFKAHSKSGEEKCKPCNTSQLSPRCKQVIDTGTFRSCQTQQIYNVFQKLNCTSKFIGYLMECPLWKVQYVGKAETAFNIRLKNHRKM